MKSNGIWEYDWSFSPEIVKTATNQYVSSYCFSIMLLHISLLDVACLVENTNYCMDTSNGSGL